MNWKMNDSGCEKDRHRFQLWQLPIHLSFLSHVSYLDSVNACRAWIQPNSQPCKMSVPSQMQTVSNLANRNRLLTQPNCFQPDIYSFLSAVTLPDFPSENKSLSVLIMSTWWISGISEEIWTWHIQGSTVKEQCGIYSPKWTLTDCNIYL